MATADVLRIPIDTLVARTLADEEALDLADPLRHLREDTDDPDVLVPFQPRSIQNEITNLVFAVPIIPTTNHNSHDIQLRPPTSTSTIAIQLAVDASPGCGGITWPAGEVLSSYIAQRGLNSLSDTNVLELGSGTGLVGLVAARLGAHVWITDQTPLIPFMQHNITLNDLSDRVTALELNWGSTLPKLLPHLQLILVADCVYFEPAFPLLVQTLADLVPADRPASDDPEILFCYKKRRKADKRFFSLLRRHFSWTDVDDNPDRPEYTRQAISLLRLHRRRAGPLRSLSRCISMDSSSTLASV